MSDINRQYEQMNAIVRKANKGMVSYQRLGLIDDFESLMTEQQQYWAYLIYNHKHTVLIKDSLKIRYQHAWKDLDKFVAPTQNPLKRVANIKAQTYARPPVRRTQNKSLQVLLSKNAKRINVAMAHACRLLNATGNVCIWPVLGTRGGLPVVLDILVIPAHETWLSENYNDYKYDIVSKYKDYYLCSVYTGESVDRERSTFCIHKTKKDVPSPFAQISEPIWVSLDDSVFGSPRTISPILDLVMGTLDIGQLEAFSAKVMYLKSFKQMQLNSSERVNVDKLEASPHTVWPDGVDAVDLVDKDFAFEAYIESKAIALAGQHGVSKVAVIGDYTDQQSWMAVSQELLHHWEEQIELWKYVEERMWENIQNTELFMDESGIYPVFTSFVPPYPSLQDPKVEWDLHIEKVKNGVETVTDRMMREHPEVSGPEEADAMWLANLTKYADMVKIKRDLNIPDNGVGNSPEVNGKIGAIVKAQEFGKLGAEGPAVDGKVTEVDHLTEAEDGKQS